ncbi:MAG TPA: hypothetical protein DCE41_17110 [Cytophagales bacterium]|nr:hypothetical protein [Cytophagales bacterium]HAA18198.1 hypothetical protein [Cytophagales bacterium]HAP59211.1 hypothetical protein [Cytophagales bacterium]
MSSRDFEKQLRKYLNKVSGFEAMVFAHHCGLIAVPMIPVNGDFSFLKPHHQNKALEAILDTLDLNLRLLDALTVDTKGKQLEVISFASLENRKKSINIAESDAIIRSTHDVRHYSILVLKEAYISAIAQLREFTFEVKEAAKNAATCLLQAAMFLEKSGRFSFGGVDHTRNYLIEVLKSWVSKTYRPAMLVEWYGSQWSVFQKALERENCQYWAKLFFSSFDSNFSFDLEGVNLRLNVPMETKARGPRAVGQFLERLSGQDKTRRLNEARVLILGDKGAGKTTLARRLKNPDASLPEEYESTKGIDRIDWVFQDEDLKARIWDFAGHVVTHAAHRFFLSERCLYIVVYDGRTDNPDRLRYWLNHMKNYGPNSDAILIINLKDPHLPQLPINLLKEQYRIDHVFWLNLGKDTNKLDRVRTHIHEYVRDHPSWQNQVIGAQDYAVKQELENLFGIGGNKNGPELISREEFDAMVKKHKASDPEELLSMLHSIGASFWYPDIEGCDTLILNPEWITDGVYALINWLANKERYGILQSEFGQAFRDQLGDLAKIRFPDAQHGFLYQLLLKYELAYESDLEKKELIIPHLLKEDQPKEGNMPVFQMDDLYLRFRTNAPLPTHMISQFIVRHHHKIRTLRKQPLVWRHGVILKDSQGSVALVRSMNWKIEVMVKGANATRMLSSIRESLRDIFDGYIAQEPNLEYQVWFNKWLKEEDIQSHVESKVPYFDPDTKENRDLTDQSIRYAIQAQSVVRGLQTHQRQQEEGQPSFDMEKSCVNLQTDLGDLYRKLKRAGADEEAEDIVEIQEILKDAEGLTDPKEVKKTLGKGLYRFLEELNEEGGHLHKIVAGVRKGKAIAQDIAEQYNYLAQWAGLPQVNKPFLKN